MLHGDLVRHEPEEREAVGHRQGVSVAKIDFELSDTVFMVQGINVPAQVVHGIDEFEEPSSIIENTRHVVRGFGQIVPFGKGLESQLFIVLEDEEFCLDTEIDAVSHLICNGQRPLQNVPAARFERHPAAPQIACEPGHVIGPR